MDRVALGQRADFTRTVASWSHVNIVRTAIHADWFVCRKCVSATFAIADTGSVVTINQNCIPSLPQPSPMCDIVAPLGDGNHFKLKTFASQPPTASPHCDVSQKRKRAPNKSINLISQKFLKNNGSNSATSELDNRDAILQASKKKQQKNKIKLAPNSKWDNFTVYN